MPSLLFPLHQHLPFSSSTLFSEVSPGFLSVFPYDRLMLLLSFRLFLLCVFSVVGVSCVYAPLSLDMYECAYLLSYPFRTSGAYLASCFSVSHLSSFLFDFPRHHPFGPSFFYLSFPLLSSASCLPVSTWLSVFRFLIFFNEPGDCVGVYSSDASIYSKTKASRKASPH